MKFLLDENIPIESNASLSRLGHDVVNVNTAKLNGKSDDDIIEFARKEQRILITLDLDFSNIISYPPGSHPGIIVVRLNSLSRKKLIVTIEQFVKSISEKEITKSLVILEDDEYRMRK